MITWAAADRLLEKIGHKPTLNELIAEHIMTLAEVEAQRQSLAARGMTIIEWRIEK